MLGSIMILVSTVLYSFVLVGLLTYTLRRSFFAATRKESLYIWGVFGFVSSYITVGSYYTVLPLEGVETTVGFIVITLIVGVISLFFGSLYFFVGWINWLTRNNVYLRLISVVAAFACAEFVRPYLFSLITWGGGSVFGAHASTWAIGAILASTPLLVFASIGGTCMLGAILVYLVSLFVYPLPLRVRAGGLFILFFLYLFVRYVVYHPVAISSPISFGTVQTSFPDVPEGKSVNAVSKERIQTTVTPLVMSFVKDQPNLIILPEDLRYLDLQTGEENKGMTIQLPDTIIVDTTTRGTVTGRKSISVMYDTKTSQTVSREKRFLFPFGEYIPYALRPILSLIVGEETLERYESRHEYTAGETPRALPTRYGAIGSLICSEVMSSTAIESLKKSNPDIVIVQSSLTWTHNNPYYMMSHIFSLKLLAVMLAKPVISVTNYGPDVMIDAYGHIVDFEENSFATHLYTLTGTTIKKIY